MPRLRRTVSMLALFIAAVAGCELVVGSDDFSLAPPDASLDSGSGAEASAEASGIDSASDAAADVEIDAGPPNLGISCGLIYCTPNAQTCCQGNCSNFLVCTDRDDAGGFTCAPRSGENCGWSQLDCDDLADCPADSVCCSAGGPAKCIRFLDCQNLQGHTVLCDPQRTNACPNDATCAARDSGRPACVGL